MKYMYTYTCVCVHMCVSQRESSETTGTAHAMPRHAVPRQPLLCTQCDGLFTDCPKTKGCLHTMVAKHTGCTPSNKSSRLCECVLLFGIYPSRLAQLYCYVYACVCCYIYNVNIPISITITIHITITITI